MIPLWLLAISTALLLRLLYSLRTRRLEARASRLAADKVDLEAGVKALLSQGADGMVTWLSRAPELASADRKSKAAVEKALSVGAAEETLGWLLKGLMAPTRSPLLMFLAGSILASEAWLAYLYRTDIADRAAILAEWSRTFWV